MCASRYVYVCACRYVRCFCCLPLLTVLFCLCLFDPPFFVLVHSWVVMSGMHGSPNIFLFCTSTPTHRPNSEYSQRRTPGGCTTTRPAILLLVLIFHFNKETSISLGETGAASPPQSPLGDHTSLGFPTSRHAQPSPPFYVLFYQPRVVLCLVDPIISNSSPFRYYGIFGPKISILFLSHRD